jgi:hypothetical protein
MYRVLVFALALPLMAGCCMLRGHDSTVRMIPLRFPDGHHLPGTVVSNIDDNEM